MNKQFQLGKARLRDGTPCVITKITGVYIHLKYKVGRIERRGLRQLNGQLLEGREAEHDVMPNVTPSVTPALHKVGPAETRDGREAYIYDLHFPCMAYRKRMLVGIAMETEPGAMRPHIMMQNGFKQESKTPEPIDILPNVEPEWIYVAVYRNNHVRSSLFEIKPESDMIRTIRCAVGYETEVVWENDDD